MLGSVNYDSFMSSDHYTISNCCIKIPNMFPKSVNVSLKSKESLRSVRKLLALESLHLKGGKGLHHYDLVA